jgi:hypothetical protein
MYTNAIATLFKICGAYGINIGLETIANESLITRARNNMVMDFIESEYTHLFFIDADIDFDPLDVFRCILRKEDVVAGAYPMKSINWQSMLNAKTPEEARDKSVSYVINLKPGTKENEIQMVNGMLEVYDSGTGFLCITRNAIDKLIEAYGEEISYTDDAVTLNAEGMHVKTKRTLYALFDTSIDIDTNRYLSEDYTFSRRWQKIGGKIWVDPNIILTHIGTHMYRGFNFITPIVDPVTSESSNSDSDSTITAAEK